LRGDDDNRNEPFSGVLFNPLADLDTACPGHLHIENSDVWHLLLTSLDGGQAVSDEAEIECLVVAKGDLD
jgi:hypothetical protein